ncbi:MAG: hypothetical protein ACLQBX_06640 [Candidatus Limnocylindrales bacterium]
MPPPWITGGVTEGGPPGCPGWLGVSHDRVADGGDPELGAPPAAGGTSCDGAYGDT